MFFEKTYLKKLHLPSGRVLCEGTAEILWLGRRIRGGRLAGKNPKYRPRILCSTYPTVLGSTCPYLSTGSSSQTRSRSNVLCRSLSTPVTICRPLPFYTCKISYSVIIIQRRSWLNFVGGGRGESNSTKKFQVCSGRQKKKNILYPIERYSLFIYKYYNTYFNNLNNHIIHTLGTKNQRRKLNILKVKK